MKNSMKCSKKRWLSWVGAAILALSVAAAVTGCHAGGGGQAANGSSPADITWVAPGSLDEFYMFASGGHSGQVYVFGIPSMRRLRTIPVFTPDPATGWGYDDKSKRMLGGFTWGDVHHPALSETNGLYDGRWLFVNDNANNRVARIDLVDFTTKEILGPLPNIMGPHCAAFLTSNSEFLFMPTRFSVPMAGAYAPLSRYKTDYHGALAAIAIDPKSGHMTLAWEMTLPPWDYDISDAGKGVSKDWAFFTCYNTEEFNSAGTEPLEEGSSQNETDYLVAFNWKAAAEAAKDPKNLRLVGGAKVMDPAAVPGLVYLLPCPKNPHGADVSPDGRYICASGKEAPVVTVYDFNRLQEAIKNKAFDGQVRGLPVLKLDAVKVAEVPVGLGPLHTQFDGQGNAYTAMFIESAIVKWRLGTWDVVDKVPVYYSVGHLAAAEGDTVQPAGRYLVSLNKISKDRFLPVGPSHPESLQLIDISGDKMRTLYEAPIDPEPHYAQIIRASRIKAVPIYAKSDNHDPNAVWSPKQAKVVRRGRTVEVFMMAVRSHFVPQAVEVNQGDTIVLHLTNIEQDRDITHGFAIPLYNLDIQVDPGETKTVTFTAGKAGVFPFYCSNFCSALHQEMQGHLLVKPAR